MLETISFIRRGLFILIILLRSLINMMKFYIMGAPKRSLHGACHVMKFPIRFWFLRMRHLERQAVKVVLAIDNVMPPDQITYPHLEARVIVFVR